MRIDVFIMTNSFLDEVNGIVEKEIQRMLQAQFDGNDIRTNDEKEIEYNIWNNPNKFYALGAQVEYEEEVDKELKELNELSVFFYYCKFETYKKTYKERLNEFKKKYEDAEEIFFIKNELEVYSKPIQSIETFQRLNTTQFEKLTYSSKKTIWFLEEKARGLGFNVVFGQGELKVYKITGFNENQRRNPEDSICFKIGILFAIGEPQKLYKELKSFKKVALELNFKETDRPYFSETYNNTSSGPKNIYSREKDMQLIYNHCVENNIEMVNDFIDAYKAVTKI